MNCNQKSPPLRESNERSKTTSFSPPTTRLSKRRKSKQNYNRKGKEDENNLGEQLLKEFADFQSSRSHKVDGCEKSGNFESNDRSEAPEENNLQPIELPAEKDKNKDQESEGNPEKPTPTSDPKEETQVIGLENTNTIQAVEATVGSEDVYTGDKDHSGTGQVEMEMGTQTETAVEPESSAEPALNSEALAVNVCHNDSKLEEINKEVHYDCESHPFKLNPTPIPLVRSNTIPGLAPSVSSSEENTYTITELVPADPVDLTSLVSSMCSVDRYDISCSNPTPTNAASWNLQIPSSSSEIQSTNVWNPADVTQHSLVQGDLGGQSKEGNQSEGLTVFLPPVTSRKEALKQLVTFVNNGEKYFVAFQ